MKGEGLLVKGAVEAVLKKACGEVEVRRKDNLIVDCGFDFICDAIGKADARPSVMNHIAVGTGTGTPSAQETGLVSELTRKAAQYAHVSGTKEMTFTTTFVAGEATGAITEAGVINASAGGTLLDRVTFAVINKGEEDELSITFMFTLS